jgi:CRISPR system Cascade subunit CasA
MIHAFLRGGSLFESVHLNLPSREDIRFLYGVTNIGSPLWESVPTSPDDKPSIKNATETYLGRLVPMSRFIRLDRSGASMLLGAGLPYPTFTDGFPAEPTATVVVRKTQEQEKPTVLSFRPSRAIWRELAAIMIKRTAEGTGGPLSLRAIRDGGKCDVIVGALARDQANIVDSIESVFSVPEQLTTPIGVSAYDAEVKTAETNFGRLSRAVETYRAALDGGWDGRLKKAGAKKGELKAKLHAAAASHYWTTVETNLPLLMSYIEALGTDAVESTRDTWRNMLFACARDAYRTACGQETPRQIRAFAEGWTRIVKLRR